MANNLRPPWYHKNLSRMKAEELLTRTNEPGTFVIRESESLPSTRVLSILTPNGINHYRIVKSKDGKFNLQTSEDASPLFFESIEHLVSHYEVPRKELPIALKVPLQEEGSSIGNEKDYDSDSEDENDASGDQDIGSNISKFFLHQFQVLKGELKDENFEKLVESYIKRKLASDLYKVDNGVKKPPHLQKLILSSAADLQKSIDMFHKKLQFLQNLFDMGENEPTQKKGCTMKDRNSASKSMSHAYTADVEGIFHQIDCCKSQVLELQEKSHKVLKDYSGRTQSPAVSPHQETYEVIPKIKSTSRSKQGICQFFLAYKSKKTKVYIAVNMKEGKVAFLKSQDEYQYPSNTVTHKAITQLMKDNSSKTSLGIAINKKLTTYNFEDFKSRELFCVMVERMKNVHSDHSSKGVLTQISVFVGTWNMGSAQFPEDISSWLKCSGIGKDKIHDSDNPYDIIAIGTQESGANDKEITTKIKEVLKSLFNIDYDLATKGNLWDIRLAIFVKPMHLMQISQVKQSVVKLGLANALGNKGAVGISFYLGSTSFCFINSHLHARVGRLAKRNQNFHDTLRNLNLGQQGFFDISNHFHHLFWFGDLNYRVDGLEITSVLKNIMGNDLDLLLDHDQLSREKRSGNAFFGFEEEKITFRPTYRYKVGSNNVYIWLKKKPGVTITNVPSWPDRVLWKSFPEVYIANTSYGSTEDIVTSDHAPVFATFDVGLISQSQDLGCNTIKSAQSKAEIEFLHVEAKIRTSCNTKFILIFKSTCLEEQRESDPNLISDWRTGRREINSSFSYPAWKADEIPKLLPALSNQRYLEDQHIQIAVKADDGHESYGECVLALKRLVQGSAQEVVACLTHLGDESGEIKLLVRVKTDINKEVDPVITNVSDLRSIKFPEDDGDSGVDFDVGAVGTTRRQTYDSSQPRTYELVGNFSDAPPVPPKKRLSKQLSIPGVGDKEPDASSDILWIGDSTTGGPCRNLHLASEVENEPEPPPVPKRQSSIQASQDKSTPIPKPRPRKSLARDIPKTVEEWLQRIDMANYEQLLMDAGWDDVDYLDFTDSDLISAGIHNEAHRQILLKSAGVIKNKKIKESGKT